MIVFSLMVIIAKILLVIHFISIIWMRLSLNVQSKITEGFITYMNEELYNIDSQGGRLGRLFTVIYEAQMSSFYLIALTLTVIGYGD
mmetsp:Transcript_40759/g.62209  ORF Transcript_40759/g.62209 Transcript_40759/m.62209 type:complete len:87 (-) Transcript_40759:41-301(-)